MRRVIVTLSLVAALSGCSTSTVAGPLPDPPSPVTTDELEALIASGGPAVVNVWASWCLPCRSEAPLIAAASTHTPDVRFIGLNVRDDPTDARRFIADYLDGTGMTFVSDRSGTVPVDLGGTRGVPITFFYGDGGTLVHVHLGVIDEPTMAQYLDEIDR